MNTAMKEVIIMMNIAIKNLRNEKIREIKK